MGEFVGQWIGQSFGDPSGRVLADFDEIEACSNGTVYLFSEEPDIPSSLVDIQIPFGVREYEAELEPLPFSANMSRFISREELRTLSSPVDFPTSARVSIKLNGHTHAEFSWESNRGTFGSGTLMRSAVPNTSRVKPIVAVKNWDDFKKEVSTFNFGECIFRGQSFPHPLRTTFHRSRRKNLHRYFSEDVPELHRSLTGRINHLFDLGRPDEFGAFLSLAQHHGYPTPLLDWTKSPFVAAWFAFQRIDNEGGNVRIFQLNRRKFQKFRQFQNLTLCPPHFSLLETLSVENDRAIPQQGVLTLTNLSDIEEHILELEKSSGQKVLTAYDLPASEAKTVLNELAMMGITRTTLFPGAESVCADLRDRMF